MPVQIVCMNDNDNIIFRIMMKRLFLIFGFWAAGTAGASAQMRLTLPEALDLALSENPTVKVAEMEVQRYDYVKRQTWGNLLPQLSASGSYTRSIVKSEMRGGISFGADNTFAVQGDLSLPLFAPSVYRTLKMNEAQMATAVEAARASRIDLTAEVKKAFYNILLAEQSLAVLRESEATVQRTVDDTQVQYDNGLMSEYDLLTARETMYAQELTVEQARKAYKISDTRYRAGAGTILELNSAQLSQTQAQLNFSQSIYDYLSAKAEYDRIVGRENQ